MIDPTPLGLAASAIEQSLKTALQFDPGTRSKLYALADNVIAVSITDMDLCCVLRLHKDDLTVALMPDEHSTSVKPDLLIQGRIADLSRLASSETYSLAGSGVEVVGRVSLLEQLHNITQTLDIDWQDALNRYLPSALVGPIGIAAQKAAKNLRSTFGSLKQQFEEYSQHESGHVITRNEFLAFSEDVRATRQQVDRLSANFERISTKRTSKEQPLS